jgi:hypothetical protein
LRVWRDGELLHGKSLKGYTYSSRWGISTNGGFAIVRKTILQGLTIVDLAHCWPGLCETIISIACGLGIGGARRQHWGAREVPLARWRVGVEVGGDE